MESKNYIEKTIMEMDQRHFDLTKGMLADEYVTFSFFEKDISREVLAEKLVDYFEKVQIKNRNNFDKLIEEYFERINDVVEPRIARKPHQKKGENNPKEARARKYYEKAKSIRDSRNLRTRVILEYSRIMMCLYMSIIKSNSEYIENFDYAVSSLDISVIIDSLKAERNTGAVKLPKTKKFNLSNPYGLDTCAFVILIIVLNKLTNDEIKGEY